MGIFYQAKWMSLQNNQVDINFERLPEDVMHIINIEYDDDDDPDKGGQKILSKGNMKKEEGKISLPYLGKPKVDDSFNESFGDDDDKEMNIEQPMRKTSDEYRLEIALLESVNLWKNLKNTKLKFQNLQI